MSPGGTDSRNIELTLQSLIATVTRTKMANQCIYNKNENVDILNVYVIDRDTFYIWLSKTDIFIHLTDRRQTFQVIHKDRNPILSQY